MSKETWTDPYKLPVEERIRLHQEKSIYHKDVYAGKEKPGCPHCEEFTKEKEKHLKAKG